MYYNFYKNTLFICIGSEIEAQNFAFAKRVTIPVKYKTATKFGSNCHQDEPVAYIALSDEENVSNCSYWNQLNLDHI